MRLVPSLCMSSSFVLACALSTQETGSRPADPAATNARGRVAAARTLAEMFEQGYPYDSFKEVLRDLEPRRTWSARLAAAEIDAAPDQTDRALKDHLARMTRWLERTRPLKEHGRVSDTELSAIEYFRLEAESWVSKKQMR